MTTIAWDGEILSADSQATEEDFISQENFPKIRRLETGETIAFCGDVPQALAFINWYSGSRDFDKYPDGLDEFEALVFLPATRKVHGYSTRPFPCEIKAKKHAIGTGAAPAMGAMLAGATAPTAARIACRLDKYSRGPVKSVKPFE